MEIKHIKKGKNNQYEISFINGSKLTTYDEVLLSNNLLYKKDLSKEDIKSIESKNIFYDVYNNALKYISKWIRSTKEIKKYLDKYEISLKDKNDIIKILKEKGFLDELRFAKAFISDKVNLTSDGPYKIKKELLSHDIDESIIDNLIHDIDKEELISKLDKLVNKKIKTSKESNYLARKKITNYFINLGYSKEMIDEVYKDSRDDTSYLEKEFDKLYKKLSYKEQDKDKLLLKIKQKLYSKGYSLSKIDEYIRKEYE